MMGKGNLAMNSFVTIEEIDDAANYIRKAIKTLPKVGLVLGSGMGGLADDVEQPVVMLFSDIPH